MRNLAAAAARGRRKIERGRAHWIVTWRPFDGLVGRRRSVVGVQRDSLDASDVMDGRLRQHQGAVQRIASMVVVAADQADRGDADVVVVAVVVAQVDAGVAWIVALVAALVVVPASVRVVVVVVV